MFQIRLFGYFRMSKDDLVMNEASMRSPQLLKLLVYLIIYRSQAVTNIELEQYLWGESEAEGQADALKNLVYRLRKLLCDNFGKGDYIITGRGNYQWNSLYSLKVDVDDFEQYYDDYMTSLSHESRNKAIDLYQGIFLKSYEAKYWSNMGIKYQSMYLQLVNDYKEEMLANKNYSELEKLCARVLNTDPYDEEWNKCLMRVLLLQKKTSHAQKFYGGLEKKLQTQSGIQKANLLRALKQELYEQEVTNRIEIESYIRDLQENDTKLKALRVDLNEFNTLVKLQNRKDTRREVRSYCILLNVGVDTKSVGGATEVQDFLTSMAMNELEKILQDNLRECDVMCKASMGQFIILLDNCNYEISLKVARRISDIFLNERSSKITKLQIDIKKTSEK